MSPSVSQRIAAVVRRMRVQHAFDAAALGALPALSAAALGICVLKTSGPGGAQPLLWGALLLPALSALAGALRPVSRLSAAKALDRALATKDLAASAWAFSQLPEAERTAFMRACLESAEHRVQRARARDALAFERPRALAPALVLGLATASLLLLEVPVEQVVQAPPPPKPRLLEQDDVAAFSQVARPLLRDARTAPEVREAARELNRLIEALGARRLERVQALAELRALQAKLAEAGSDEADAALREALAELGRALADSEHTRPLADALRENRTEDARRALSELAGELDRAALADARERSRLERALERGASEPRDAALEKKLERLRRELDRLLKRKNQGAEPSARERRLLRKKRRELEQLQREQARAKQAQRELERLRRELKEAASQLAQNAQQQAGQNLQRGAGELDRLARSQQAQRELSRLRQQVEQLRQLLDKQRGRRQSLAQAGQSDARGRSNRQGDGEKLSLARFARAAAGKRSKRGDDAASGRAADDGDESSQQEARLLTPGQGRGSPTLVMQAPQLRENPGGDARNAVGGSQGGHGGESRSTEQATQLESKRVDTQVHGALGEGPSRSETILEAGRRGFVRESYRQVHAEYERHAESVLERDHVPGGYRFYVRRYFQLIRPREAAP